MKKVVLDLRTTDDRETLHDRIASALNLPDHYGRNLDALYDCLTELTEDTCVGIYVGEDASAYEKRAVDVFLDAEEENAHLCVFAFSGNWENCIDK